VTPRKGSDEAVDGEKGSTHIRSLTTAEKNKSPLTRTEKKSPRVPAAATATRLQSLYSSSVLSKQRLRRHLLSGAHVPNKFQVRDVPLCDCGLAEALTME
jgi:hypothetical protein